MNTARGLTIATCLGGIASIFLAASQLHGATYLNDTFTDGGFTNGADLHDGAWYGAASTGGGTLPVPNLSVTTVSGFGDGNVLSVSTNANFQRIYAPDVGGFLATGETLSLSFDFRVAANSVGNSAGFRFGLFNQGGTFINGHGQQNTTDDDFGWVTTIGVGAIGLQLGYEGAGNEILGNSGSGAILGIPDAEVTNQNLSLATNYRFEYTIERTSSSEGIVSLFLDGELVGSATRTGLDDSNFTFDLLAFGTGSNAMSYYLDNVILAVPEPGKSLLFALGATGLLMRRRRINA